MTLNLLTIARREIAHGYPNTRYCPRTMRDNRVQGVFQWIIRSVSFIEYDAVKLSPKSQCANSN